MRKYSRRGHVHPSGRGACGKLRFASRREAKLGAAGLGARIRVYLCQDCRAWHITNAEKENPR